MRQSITELVSSQRKFFRTGQTLDVGFRLRQLDLLHKAIRERESKILEALKADLGKCGFEAFASEIAVPLDELGFLRKHLREWVQPVKVHTPIIQAVASSEMHYEPKGVVLVVSPWNYPFQLMMVPLIGAISAGNCVVLKPSELAPHTSQLIEELITSTFSPEYIGCVQGDVKVATELLAERWDHIFFTGGGRVARVVLQAAANHLTPVTLELGGKSPVIVDEQVDLKTAVRRIAWGKYLNAGQSCVAPDYVLVPRTLEEEFLSLMKFQLEGFFGKDPQKSPDYGRVINSSHFDRIQSYLSQGRVLHGGKGDREDLYIEPTVLGEVDLKGSVMEEEIFGPVLPLISYDRWKEAIDFVQERPKPLAAYVFSTNKKHQREVVWRVPFGGGCINDTVMHYLNPHLPFGGVGASGMGNCHGKFSFETFSHGKGVMNRTTLVDPSLRYPPYGNRLSLLKKIFR